MFRVGEFRTFSARAARRYARGVALRTRSTVQVFRNGVVFAIVGFDSQNNLNTSQDR
jgi:hypothetical protein